MKRPRFIALLLPLVALMESVAVGRQRLLLFYQAALNAQSGYPELWARDVQRVRQGDAGNAYYEWSAGGSQ